MKNTNDIYGYTHLYKKTLSEGSVKFIYKGEKFKTFIDWEKDFCLTHYNSNGQNSWFVSDVEGLKIKLNDLIK